MRCSFGKVYLARSVTSGLMSTPGSVAGSVRNSEVTVRDSGAIGSVPTYGLLGSGASVIGTQPTLPSQEPVFAIKVLKKLEVMRRNQISHTKTERDILSIVKHRFILPLRCSFQTPLFSD